MARQNLISAELLPAQKSEVLDKLSSVRGIMPFLMSLSIDQRIKLRKMGRNSVEYVKLAYIATQQFPQALPADFPVGEMRKDVDLEEQLFEISTALQALTELVNDTYLAVGSDNMKAADEVYSFLKMAAKTDVNAKALVEKMAKHYKSHGKATNKNGATNTPNQG